MRPAKSAALNSQQATVANLRKFKGRGLARRTTLRSTFTGAGIDMLPRIEYLNALIEDGCAGHMSVEACSLNETACLRLPDGHPLAITAAHYDALAQEYHLAANWYVAQVRAGKKPSLQQFAWALRRLLYTQHSCTECGAGCGYLSVDPGGHLFACHREGKSIIGHLDTGVDEELRAKWKDNRFYTRCPDGLPDQVPLRRRLPDEQPGSPRRHPQARRGRLLPEETDVRGGALDHVRIGTAETARHFLRMTRAATWTMKRCKISPRGCDTCSANWPAV